MVLAAGCLQAGYTTWAVSHGNAARQEQAQLVEHKICTTLGLLAADSPPPGNPVTNPSRGYLQSQHRILSQLKTDLGCVDGRK